MLCRYLSQNHPGGAETIKEPTDAERNTAAGTPESSDQEATEPVTRRNQAEVYQHAPRAV